MKNLVVVISLLLGTNLIAQKVKFENFKLVEYDCPPDQIQFFNITTIDSNGVVNIHNGNGSLMFSHQLSENEIQELNDLFSKKLNAYIVKQKLNEDYYGLRFFISFDVNNKSKNLCYVSPFMNEQFNKTITRIIYKKGSSTKVKSSIDTEALEKQIKKQERIDVLPKRPVNPPPQTPE
ncbi:hypothetical protein H9Y05_13235 [Crocinitomicaceae bacterium CZZ-1]|uniref:Uncharacterized protein n=1 Tax=Taishania pollutisoli TaxID=2766479 RepID=A0A8J6U2P2_9FLAO|nr:hypothetical protein [Taishania pollutisoli]MBC9813435.1 hypothetical protein [Taishania pollutisoli]MBX2950678.1 hypothetical protein [Crocinitomicaceae bacterium]NGF76525.1 hypothetical protein [Fluviicola sp. SGL-29]